MRYNIPPESRVEAFSLGPNSIACEEQRPPDIEQGFFFVLMIMQCKQGTESIWQNAQHAEEARVVVHSIYEFRILEGDFIRSKL